jgi:hypothetical protein
MSDRRASSDPRKFSGSLRLFGETFHKEQMLLGTERRNGDSI